MKNASSQPAKSITWKKEWSVFAALVFILRILCATFRKLIDRNSRPVEGIILLLQMLLAWVFLMGSRVA